MATRGKEIQDFIKSQKKTARQRFEECGYEYVCKTNKNELRECDFLYRNKKEQIIITFYGAEKELSIYWGIDEITIDMETLKLINYQVKELGWL